MRIDFTHNKILADAVSERFIKSAEENLLPMLEERFIGLRAVVMYEDYLSCDLRREGAWYYPFTVVTIAGEKHIWAFWQVDDVLFTGAVPYAYQGDAPLTFAFLEEGSLFSELEEKVAAKAMNYEEGLMVLEIQNPMKDPLFLSGKYSQTFVDEINRRMTAEIAKACGVKGLAESGVSLSLPFAVNTFMEHTTENVTYRRFQLSAKGCAPRDFWVKWTRKNASSAFSLADDVSSEDVEVDLGEDVPQKIREKEFRYLAVTDPAKYSSSTGKKNVTEWRDLIRRALKRGDLQKAEETVTVENTDRDLELNRALNELLKNYQPNPKPAEQTPFATLSEKPEETIGQASEGSVETAAKEPSEELFAIAEEKNELPVQEAFPEEKEEPEQVSFSIPEEPISLHRFVNYPDLSDKTAEQQIVSETIRQSAEIAEKAEHEEWEKQRNAERIRAELEAQIRAEYENKLLREREEMKRENDRLLEETRIAREQQAAKDEKNRIEAEERAKAEARERERLAEAARIAIAERDRLVELKTEEERAKAEALRAETERREAEAKMAREEEKRRQETARLASERVEMESRAKEARARAEREARMRSGYSASAQTPAPTVSAVPSEQKDKPAEEKVHYTYTSHLVYMYFRHPVDSQITAKIREIIGTTLEFFHKDHVFMQIQATVVDLQTVVLNFRKYPEQETDLLVNIIKVLGNSKLGVAKITLD